MPRVLPLVLTTLLTVLSFTQGEANPATGQAKQTHYIDRIVPTPQSVEYGDWLSIGENTASRHVTIHLVRGETASTLDRIAVEKIKERLIQLAPEKPLKIYLANVITPPDQLEQADLEIHLGAPSNHRLIRRHFKDKGLAPPERTEGYRISTRSGTKEQAPALFLAGHDDRGTYYAAQSLIQMLTTRNGELALRALNITDWPAYRMRASGNDEKIPSGDTPEQAVDWLSKFKLNAWAVGQSYHWPDNWREMPEERMKALRQATRIAGRGVLDLQFQIHPFGRANDPDGKNRIRISDPEERKTLTDLALRRLEEGASHILLRADDFHELAPEDREHYPDKATAHAELIRELYARMQETDPESKLLFCPPYYTGEEARKNETARQYLRALGEAVPRDVMILWTGPEVVSRAFETTGGKRFAKLVQRKPVLWDNTVFREESSFGYPYLYGWHMFHPLETKYPENHYETSPGVRFNYGYDGTQMNRVANIPLADRLWNPESYEPETSLRRAIALVAGPEAVDKVLRCARELQRIYDLRHSPARILSGPPPASPEKFVRLLDDLSEKTDNQALVDELRDAWYAQAETAEALDTVARRINRLENERLLKISPDKKDWTTSAKNEWQAAFKSDLLSFSFPFETESEAGAYAAAETTVRVPESPNGRYYLGFIADDDYYAEGDPPEAYPGYFFKQVLINDRVVWEEDVEGMEAPKWREVDVTEYLQGQEEVKLTLRGFDARGVTNLGVQMSFSPLFLYGHFAPRKM